MLFPICVYRALSQTSPSSGGAIPSPCSPCLANTAMVSTSSRPVCSQPFANSTLPWPSLDAKAGSSTHQSPVSRLATICQSYTEAGVSESTQNLLLAAWRKGTSDTYASAWRKWASWCSARKINPVKADISSILEF